MDFPIGGARAPFDRLSAGDIEGIVRLLAPGIEWLATSRRKDEKPAGRREGKIGVFRSRVGICPLVVAKARLP